MIFLESKVSKSGYLYSGKYIMKGYLCFEHAIDSIATAVTKGSRGAIAPPKTAFAPTIIQASVWKRR